MGSAHIQLYIETRILDRYSSTGAKVRVKWIYNVSVAGEDSGRAVNLGVFLQLKLPRICTAGISNIVSSRTLSTKVRC